MNEPRNWREPLLESGNKMSVAINKAQDFIYNISVGLACCRYISVWKIIGNYIITKHQPHVEYLYANKTTCNTAYRLFKYDADAKCSSHCQNYLTKALRIKEGRVNTKVLKEWYEYIIEEERTHEVKK